MISFIQPTCFSTAIDKHLSLSPDCKFALMECVTQQRIVIIVVQLTKVDLRILCINYHPF